MMYLKLRKGVVHLWSNLDQLPDMVSKHPAWAACKLQDSALNQSLLNDLFDFLGEALDAYTYLIAQLRCLELRAEDLKGAIKHRKKLVKNTSKIYAKWLDVDDPVVAMLEEDVPHALVEEAGTSIHGIEMLKNDMGLLMQQLDAVGSEMIEIEKELMDGKVHFSRLMSVYLPLEALVSQNGAPLEKTFIHMAKKKEGVDKHWTEWVKFWMEDEEPDLAGTTGVSPDRLN